MRRQIGIVRDVIFHPTSAFQEIVSVEGKFFKVGLVLLGFSIIFEAARENIYGFGSLLEAAISTPVLEIASIYFVYYIGRKLDGKGNIYGIVSVFGYASIPQIIGFAVVPLVLVLGSLADVTDVVDVNNLTVDDLLHVPSENYFSGFNQFLWLTTLPYIFLIWAFALGVIAIKEAHRFTYAKSVITIIIAIIISYVISAALGFLLGGISILTGYR